MQEAFIQGLITLAAWILASCAFLPVSLFELMFITMTGVCISYLNIKIISIYI